MELGHVTVVLVGKEYVFPYGNVGTSIGTVAVAGGTGWFSIDVSSYIPSSGEFAVTLVCRDNHMTVDGTTAYIQLTA